MPNFSKVPSIQKLYKGKKRILGNISFSKVSFRKILTIWHKGIEFHVHLEVSGVFIP